MLNQYDDYDLIADKLSDKVIEELDKKNFNKIKKLSLLYKIGIDLSDNQHFGFCLYIRNNYIYNNPLLIEKVEPDEFSSIIYKKILNKI